MATCGAPSYPLYYKVTRTLLSCTGLWVSSSDRRVHKKIVAVYVTFLLTSFVAATHRFCATFTDLLVGIEALLHSAFLFHTAVTYTLLVWNQTRIMRMFKMAETNFNHFYKTFDKCNRYQVMEEKGTAVLTISVGTIISTVHISYLYVTRFYMVHLDFTEKQFLYPVSLPFELNNVTYNIVFAIQFVTIICDFFVHVTSISLCIGFINLLCAQLFLLGETITEITSKSDIDTEYSQKVTDTDILISEQVKVWTVQHNLLFRFYNDIQHTFGISILELLINCELIFCLSSFQTFQMFQDSHYEQFLKNFCLLAALIVHCFVYFLYGEKLHAKSTSFRDHINGGKWYNCHKTFKSSYKIILERTQLPIVFKGADLVPVTIASFIMCLKAAFSYFNLLLALKNTS